MSDTDPNANKGGLEYQVGMLAGQVSSILTSINLWQQGNQARDQRVETLERRLNTIEGQLATKDDLKGVSDELGRLATAVAEGRGKDRALGGASTQLATWAAVIVALLALVNSYRNTREILHQERRTPPPPVIQQFR
jgi:hypothetical protein